MKMWCLTVSLVYRCRRSRAFVGRLGRQWLERRCPDIIGNNPLTQLCRVSSSARIIRPLSVSFHVARRILYHKYVRRKARLVTRRLDDRRRPYASLSERTDGTNETHFSRKRIAFLHSRLHNRLFAHGRHPYVRWRSILARSINSQNKKSHGIRSYEGKTFVMFFQKKFNCVRASHTIICIFNMRNYRTTHNSEAAILFRTKDSLSPPLSLSLSRLLTKLRKKDLSVAWNLYAAEESL